MVRKNVRGLEAALLAWIAVWVLAGWLVNREVRGLAELGDTVVLAGGSMQQTAKALDSLSSVPFVGRDIREVAASARRTARSAVINGRKAHDDADRLAVLLWITVAATPILPAVLWYGWLRQQGRV
jgi:hypothetical protein